MSAADRPSLDPVAGAGLAVLALLIRLPGLGRSLGYDELFTLSRFSRSPLAAITEQVAAANHPLASLLVWVTSAFSEGEVGLRLPFVLLGALTAPALAWSVTAAAGRRAGLVAGALFAVAPWPVLAAQELRGYGPMLLFAALLPGLLLWLLRTNEDAPAPRAALALTAAAVALGAWSHATFFAPCVALLGAVALGTRLGASARGRRLALAGLGAGLLGGLLLWSPILGRTWKYARRSVAGDLPTLTPGPLDGVGALNLLGGGSIALGLGLLALATVPALARRGRALEAAVFLAPLAAALALLCARPLGFPRFLGFALPALLALAACGLAGLVRDKRFLCAALAGLLLLSTARTSQDLARERHDLRGALRVAVERGVELGGAPILALGPGAELCLAYGPARPDPRGELLGDHLDGPLVVVVPLPIWLEHAPELRSLLYGPEWAAPVVLPGSESHVLVFASAAEAE